MDRDSNADDVLGRSSITGTDDQQSTPPARELVPRIDLGHEDGPQERAARTQDTYSNPRSDDIYDIGQRDWPLSHSASELDEITEHQEPSYRPPEQRELDGLSRPPDKAQDRRQNPDKLWLPFCARRTASLLFMATFALMAASLEVLFTVSRQNSGLSGDMPSIRYSWSYGTTGILTLTTALWHRLDYEAKVLAPWLRAYPITTSKDALLVDYVDALSLLAPFQALRNKDYEVVYSSTVSVLLQVLVVLSTALFTLVPTNLVNEAEPVFITSRFVDDPALLKNSEFLLPYYITMGTDFTHMGNVRGMMRKTSTRPEGCTNQFAHQTFYAASSSLEQVVATVHGLALRLACETGSVGKRVPVPQFVYQEDGLLISREDRLPYFEIEYQGCQATIDWFIHITYPSTHAWVGNNHTFEQVMVLRGVPGFARNRCNSTEQADYRLVFLSAEVEWRSNNQSIVYEGYETVAVNIDATVTQAVALVCTPSLEQTLLDVSRSRGGVQSVARRSDSPAEMLRVIQPWDFITFFFENGIDLKYSYNVVAGNTTVWADRASQVVLAFCGQSCLGASGLLNDKAFLQDILAAILADYAATTAHTMLTEQANITSTGTSSSIAVRLWVQPLVCHAMVALLVLITLTIAGFQFKRKKKLTRRVNPGSVAATSILLGQAASSSFPTGLGPASVKALREALDGLFANHDSLSSCRLQRLPTMDEQSLRRTITDAQARSFGKFMFQKPVPLRPVSYIALIATIAACGTALMVSFRKSTDERGLGDANSSEYLLLAWTTVPATILTVISWWLSSIDTQVRLLAPYHLLKSNKCGRSALRMDLLRGLIPFVLYQELQFSNLAAASTTLAALLAATLTTVSASMFHVVTFPVKRPIELSPNTVFTRPPPNDYIGTSHLASLILEANLSYPQGSYQDLVFPEFSMTPLGVGNASHPTNASLSTIKVTAPALRPHLSCRMYSPTDIAAAYMRNVSLPGGHQRNGISVKISWESRIRPLYANGGYETAFFETGNVSEFMFATATIAKQAGAQAGYSSVLYIWGYHDTSLGPVTNISAAGCNKSVELVDVDFSLLEPDLRLDLSNAPTIIESTARDIHGQGFVGSFRSKGLYDGLAFVQITNHNVFFDPFFRQLVTSRYAIPVSAIGDPALADTVMDAIRLHHGIIGAQFINSNYRINMNSWDAMENAPSVLIPTLFNQSSSDGSASYPATMIYPFGNRRVVQEPTATAILEALLLSILILVMLGWYLGPSEPALPRSPSSVGSLLALLAGGNILEHLYDGGPEPLSWDDVKRRLGDDSKLYLGWNSSNGDEGVEQRRFGIWITD